ncbi:alkaline phosphatase family protein [Paenibacillus sp. 481]|nr:alkaline phosphatase family protein [Paenibacillus sp. 481]
MLVTVLFANVSGCSYTQQSQSKPRINSSTISNLSRTNKVVLLIIDSLMDKPLQEAINQGRAPALAYMIKKGYYVPQAVSAFPTMSVTVDSTLFTGKNPNSHHIPGLIWYSQRENRVINYGTGLGESVKQGLKQVLEDGIFHLNNTHLNKQVQTIHEQLHASGKTSASINALVYRGNKAHKLYLPKAVAGTTGIADSWTTLAPKWLSLASLSQMNPANGRNAKPWQSYGLNDRFSTEEWLHLRKQGHNPDLAVVYFPDNDHRVHKDGPQALEGIEKADRQLQSMLSAFRSWDEAMQQHIWIVLGDSGQTHIDKDRKKALIDVRDVVKPYHIVSPGKLIHTDSQIVAAVNERMAYIYAVNKQQQLPLAQLARHMQREGRIDVIAWKEGEHVHVVAGESGLKSTEKAGLSAATSVSKRLIFRPNGPYKDSYGQRWSLEGNTGLLDIRVDGREANHEKGQRGHGQNNDVQHMRQIHYGNYPDALARLYSALHSHDGSFLVVTAKPGYEFVGEGSPTHVNGGGHGSLHKQDSHVPIIVVGTDTKPLHWRLVDLKEWIVRLCSRVS